MQARPNGAAGWSELARGALSPRQHVAPHTWGKGQRERKRHSFKPPGPHWRACLFVTMGAGRTREWQEPTHTSTFSLCSPQIFPPNYSTISGVKGPMTEPYLYHLCLWESYINLHVSSSVKGRQYQTYLHFSKDFRTEYIYLLKQYWAYSKCPPNIRL